ncbi:MAG: hypothetical protein CM15mP49_08380 [Actinomycetota bacterium]|nr:MAG: hypothetical protein CM15mP49_08380 [Actinomycetota bacterium]
MVLKLAKQLIFVTALFTFLVACSSNSNESVETISSESTNQDTSSAPYPDSEERLNEEDTGNLISFGNEILPIIENACALCHTGRGPGVPHAKLDTAAEVSAYAFAIGAVVDSGYMPPWPASDLSVPFLHDASLDVDQRELIVEWAQAGAPVDVDGDTPVMPSQEVPFLVAYDQELSSPNFYDGERGQPDEYRCFIFDPQLTETKYLTGYEFIPDQTEVVHHLVGYRVTAEYREAADRKDASEDQGGWSCFGSTGLGSDEILTFGLQGQELSSIKTDSV